jgi:hypothetical protein
VRGSQTERATRQLQIENAALKIRGLPVSVALRRSGKVIAEIDRERRHVSTRPSNEATFSEDGVAVAIDRVIFDCDGVLIDGEAIPAGRMPRH